MNELRRRLRVLFHRDRFESDLWEEMQSHLDMQAEENQNGGMSSADARSAARRRFGNTALVQESSRDAWGWMAIERILQDIRYAARTLRQNPGFTAVVVLTLALGIGVNTAIFGFVDRLLWRELPWPQSDRLAALSFASTRSSYVNDGMSYPDYAYFREHNQVFSGLAAHDEIDAKFQFAGRKENINGEIVSANYFAVLRVPPFMGRGFTPEEDEVPGRNPVVVIAYDLWQRRFGGDPGVLGRPVAINGANFTIIGIAPRGFAGLLFGYEDPPQFWVPAMMYPVICTFAEGSDLQHNWGNHWLRAIGRLKDGVRLAAARTNFAGLVEQLKSSHWRVWSEFADGPLQSAGRLTPARDARLSESSRKTAVTVLGMLFAVVAAVLLIACSNAASLMFARALKRQREIGVRLALGAGRRRLVQQLITESLLLTLLSGAAGIGVALCTSRALAAYARALRISLPLEAGLDGRILAFALGLSVLTGLVFGIIPLRQTFQMAIVPTLKLNSTGSGSRGFGLRNALVIVQVALSVVLVVGASLFVQTLANARATDVTRDPARVLLLNLDLAERKYSDARANLFFRNLESAVRSLPGVRQAAFVSRAPLGGGGNSLDLTDPAGGWKRNANFNIVSSEYFQTIGLPLLRGRLFDGSEAAGKQPVAVINEVMAQRYWPREEALGKRLRFLNPPVEVEIVGIVRDGRFRSYRDKFRPCFYLNLYQAFGATSDSFMHYVTSRMKLEVRTAADSAVITAAVLREIHRLDNEIDIPPVQTLASYRDSQLGEERLSAALLTSLGGLAILIAAIGLYGVLTFAVAQRTREIGIRMALGAASRKMLGSVLGNALALVGCGLAVGLVAARLLGKLVSSLLFGVSASDALTYAAAGGILLAVGCLAAYLPARRASRIDPMVALRYE